MKRKYRIKERKTLDADALIVMYYVVQVHRWFGWVNIKWFHDPDDESYALRCAEELCEMLNSKM